ncbi:MAG: chorismate mutase [Bacteroidales bacterium]
MKEFTLDILPLHEWLDFDACLPCLPDRQAARQVHPLIISGPCSAESREQVLKTAHALAETKAVKIFRAGLWKPRTRPDSFEGVGAAGLAWMKQVKKETGLLTCVEVATPEHVELSVTNNIDILWIGARTTVNPFSVQEIAEALKGIDIPVMVKNPVNPDIGLWLGALERINHAGIRKIIAIHRGFYTYNSKPYRNSPIWEIPIELMRLCPELPVICDPSHITGNYLLLESVSQKAMDLEMDGLMIETHVNPQKALSDSGQQITPAELKELISKLVIRNHYPENSGFRDMLEQLRSEIDVIDAELIHLLSKRMHLVEQIGNYKKENNITILQIKRWNKVVRESLELGENLGLNKEFLVKLLRVIHEESIQKQTEIFNK